MQDILIIIKFSDYWGKEIAFNNMSKKFVILDDIEWKWWTWLKNNGLENYYTQEYKNVNLLNLFNYIKERQYKKVEKKIKMIFVLFHIIIKEHIK